MVIIWGDDMDSTNLSRRDLGRLAVGLAGLGAASVLVTPSGRAVLEGLVDREKPSPENTHSAISEIPVKDVIENNIAQDIAQGIDLHNKARHTSEYRGAFDMYNGAIWKAEEQAGAVMNKFGLDDPRYGNYKGLEVVGRMWQSRLLLASQSNNIIFPNEVIIIKGLPTMTADIRLGNMDQRNNLYKALENYGRVQEILAEQERGVKLPVYVGQGILGERGMVADADKVQQRINETVDALVRNHVPERQIPVLMAKKAQKVQ